MIKAICASFFLCLASGALAQPAIVSFSVTPMSTAEYDDLKRCTLRRNSDAVSTYVDFFFVKRASMTTAQIEEYDSFGALKASLEGCYSIELNKAFRFSLQHLVEDWARAKNILAVDPLGTVPISAGYDIDQQRARNEVARCTVEADRPAVKKYLAGARGALAHVLLLQTSKARRCIPLGIAGDLLMTTRRADFDAALRNAWKTR